MNILRRETIAVSVVDAYSKLIKNFVESNIDEKKVEHYMWMKEHGVKKSSTDGAEDSVENLKTKIQKKCATIGRMIAKTKNMVHMSLAMEALVKEKMDKNEQMKLLDEERVKLQKEMDLIALKKKQALAKELLNNRPLKYVKAVSSGAPVPVNNTLPQIFPETIVPQFLVVNNALPQSSTVNSTAPLPPSNQSHATGLQLQTTFETQPSIPLPAKDSSASVQPQNRRPTKTKTSRATTKKSNEDTAVTKLGDDFRKTGLSPLTYEELTNYSESESEGDEGDEDEKPLTRKNKEEATSSSETVGPSTTPMDQQ